MMSQAESAPRHIQTTETLLRLYVLLAHHLDRCRTNESIQSSSPEPDLQRHLADTRDSLDNLLSTNRIVPQKVTEEYERVMNLAHALNKKPVDVELAEQARQEREVLRIKALTLSDLLAVFRSA